MLHHQLLKKIVGIRSWAPYEKDLAFFCSKFLSNLGFKTELFEWDKDRFNVVSTIGKPPYILLSAHLDTVPPFNFSSNPLKLKKEGNFYKGLGVYDMKAGLAIILNTAKYFKQKNFGLKIVLTSDEEIDSAGTWAAKNANEYKDCAIALVPEIIDSCTSIKEEKTHSPLPVLIGRRGRGVYICKINTLARHGAEGGDSSSIDLAMKINFILKELNYPAYKKFKNFPKPSCFIRFISSTSKALELPTECTLEIDAHFGPNFNHKSFLEFLKKNILKKLKLKKKSEKIDFFLKPRKMPYLCPYLTDLKNPLVKRAIFLIGQKIDYGLTVADENIIALENIPVISWAPRGGNAHNKDEWLSITDFDRVAKKYIYVLNSL